MHLTYAGHFLLLFRVFLRASNSQAQTMESPLYRVDWEN